MRSIAIFNQKGGVGKTTTAVHIAAALALRRKEVLLVDMDPQTHASMHVGVELGENDHSLYDVLINGASVLETVKTARKRLMVIPSHLDLVAAEIELPERPNRETILRDAITPLYEALDYCIIDCLPSLGLLAINALAAAHEVIIPLQPHFLALQGLGRLLETVTLVRQSINPRLRVSGILFSMFETGTRLAQEVTGDVQAFIDSATPEDAWYGAKVFETRIRRNIKLAECPSFGQTIFDYAPSSNGAEDYAALAKEIERMAPVARPTEEVASSAVPLPPEPAIEIADGAADASEAAAS